MINFKNVNLENQKIASLELTDRIKNHHPKY